VFTSSESMCAHCGFCGASSLLVRCKLCGVGVHDVCRPWKTAQGDDVCEECSDPLVAATPCSCCGPDVKGCDAPTSSQRLTRVLVYHGYRFVRAWHARRGSVLAGRSSTAGQMLLSAAPDEREYVIFAPSELPECGVRPISIDLGGADGLYVSRPLVMHSLCLSTLFQEHTGNEGFGERVALAMRELEHKPLLDPASIRSPQQACARADDWLSLCRFCGWKDGYVSRCLHFSLHYGRGCDGQPFHVACGVRAGMQRIARREGCGLACTKLHRRWRVATMNPSLSPWLVHQPGLSAAVAARAVVTAYDLQTECQVCKDVV